MCILVKPMNSNKIHMDQPQLWIRTTICRSCHKAKSSLQRYNLTRTSRHGIKPLTIIFIAPKELSQGFGSPWLRRGDEIRGFRRRPCKTNTSSYVQQVEDPVQLRNTSVLTRDLCHYQRISSTDRVICPIGLICSRSPVCSLCVATFCILTLSFLPNCTHCQAEDVRCCMEDMKMQWHVLRFKINLLFKPFEMGECSGNLCAYVNEM